MTRHSIHRYGLTLITVSSHDAMKVMKFFREILTRKFLTENLRKYYKDEKF